MATTFAPSVVVADELRQYAKEKEEEMRQRLAAYRTRKEGELKAQVGEMIIEFEINEYFVKRIRAGKSADFHKLERDMDVLIDRITLRWGSACSAQDEGVVSGDPSELRDRVRAKLGEVLDDVRFKRECVVIDECEAIKAIVEDIRTAAETPVEFSSVAANSHLPTVNAVNQFASKVEEVETNREKSDASLEHRMESVVSDILESSIASFANEFQSDMTEFRQSMSVLTDDEVPRDVLSYRRRLQLTVQKRIHDLTVGYHEAKARATQEVVGEYQYHLLRVLTKYFDSIVSGDVSTLVSETANGQPSLTAIWEARRVPLKDRMKFIQRVFEHHSSPELICLVNTGLKRYLNDVHSVQSEQFRIYMGYRVGRYGIGTRRMSGTGYYNLHSLFVVVVYYNTYEVTCRGL